MSGTPHPRDYDIRIWYSAEKGDECYIAQVVESSQREAVRDRRSPKGELLGGSESIEPAGSGARWTSEARRKPRRGNVESMVRHYGAR